MHFQAFAKGGHRDELRKGPRPEGGLAICTSHDRYLFAVNNRTAHTNAPDCSSHFTYSGAYLIPRMRKSILGMK